MAVLTGTALCASLPLAGAAHAATPAATISVSVNGAAPGTMPTVSGVIDLAATITPVPGSPVQMVRFGFPFGPPALYGVVTPAPGQCDSTCTVHFSLNTAALLPYATGGAEVPAMTDGTRTIPVSVISAASNATAYANLAVDNHRPSAGTAPAGAWPVRVGKSLSWTVTPSVSATATAGTAISDVELEAPGNPALPVTHFAKNADGSWTVTADAGALPAGATYRVAAVATDSNGTVSYPLTEVIAGANETGFTLNAPAATVTGPDWHALSLSYSYPSWLACGWSSQTYGGPTNVELQVDGTVWQDSPVNIANLSSNAAGSCILPATGSTGAANKPLPLGKHTLTWVVTDSAGIKETATEPVTVALPLTSDWPTTAKTYVAGSTIRLTPKITSADGVSALQSWSITAQNGVTLASGNGSTAPALALATSATQETGGSLLLHLVSTNGLTTDQSFTYQTGWATAAFAHLSATSVKLGTWYQLSATVWDRPTGIWTANPGDQASIQYQWAAPGSNIWHNGSVVHVAGPQVTRPPAVWIKATGSACFRAVYTQTYPLITPYGSTLIPATSAPVCVTVK
ncbi:hypothetical protein [Streptacidiphilus sp. MAP12-20]|uniref:hypothetical protein n=1 Tax=Streptacidiphilus sp. MAP12-20 TaxID=3156299 RepID=UPI003515E1AC